MLLKYVLAWLPMVLLAIINGLARDVGYKKYMGELAAHQLSTVSLILLFAFYIRFIIKTFPPASATQALVIGLIWLVLTLAFEFSLGRIRGYQWSYMLQDYNLLQGRVWLFIPLWVLVAPYLFYRMML